MKIENWRKFVQAIVSYLIIYFLFTFLFGFPTVTCAGVVSGERCHSV